MDQDETMADHILIADANGVWRRFDHGNMSGIHWDEIFRITGYRFDYRISVVTVLEFDFEHGEYLELQSDTPGFDQVLLAIIKRFQILPQMIDQLNGMSHGDEPIELWSKIKA